MLRRDRALYGVACMRRCSAAIAAAHATCSACYTQTPPRDMPTDVCPPLFLLPARR